MACIYALILCIYMASIFVCVCIRIFTCVDTRRVFCRVYILYIHKTKKILCSLFVIRPVQKVTIRYYKINKAIGSSRLHGRECHGVAWQLTALTCRLITLVYWLPLTRMLVISCCFYSAFIYWINMSGLGKIMWLMIIYFVSVNG